MTIGIGAVIVNPALGTEQYENAFNAWLIWKIRLVRVKSSIQGLKGKREAIRGCGRK